MNEKKPLALSEKYSLTIGEAAEYFSIGTKRMRRLAEDHLGTFSVYNGNRYLIIRDQFEEYMKRKPIIHSIEEKKEQNLDYLADKDILNAQETILFYHLSHRKFKRLLEENDDLPFIAYYRKRKIILKREFEIYLEENPEIKEELNARKNVSETS